MTFEAIFLLVAFPTALFIVLAHKVLQLEERIKRLEKDRECPPEN